MSNVDVTALPQPAGTGGATTRLGRLLVPTLFGLAPFATILLSWPANGASGSTSGLRPLVLPLLAAELAVIIVAGLSKAPPARPDTRTKLLLAALMAVALGTAAFVAQNHAAAVLRTTAWIIHLLFGVALYRLLIATKVRAADILLAICAGFILSSLAILVLAWSDLPSDFDWIHGVPGYDNIRRLGYYSAAIGGVAIGWMAISTRRVAPLASVVAILAFTMIFWSGSRGGLAAIVVAYGTMMPFSPGLRRVNVIAAIALSMVAGALLSMTAATHAPHMDVLQRLGSTAEAGSGAEMTSGRTVMWEEALHAIAERPLFGHGEAQTSSVLPMGIERHYIHPHNGLLQFLLAWGLVGTALIAALTLPWLIRNCLALRSAGEANLPWMLGIASLVIFSAVDGTLYHVLPLAHLAAFAALVQAGTRQSAIGSR